METDCHEDFNEKHSIIIIIIIISECSKSAQKEYKTRRDWAGKVIHFRIMQDIEILSCDQVISSQPRIRPGNWDTQNSPGFCDTHRSPTLSQTTTPSDNQ